MGRTYLFECPKCGYRARVAGGASEGAHFAVQTILCHDCKELHDVVTALKVAEPTPAALPREPQWLRSATRAALAPPSFSAAFNRLPPRSARPLHWLRFPPGCPVSPQHRIREWKTPDLCPRCGTFLEPSGLPYRVWD
jgi:hypothetical protein